MTPEQIKQGFAKALAAKNAGKLDAARTGFARILRSRPATVEAHFHLAEIAAERGDFVTGAGHFEAALKLKPAQAEIWLSYLEMAARHPDKTKLKQLLGRAGSVIEAKPAAGYFKGLVWRETDPPKAIAAFRDAIEQGETRAEIYLTLSDVLGAQGDGDAALDALEDGLRARPEHKALLAARIDLLRSLGQMDAARKAALGAIDLAPETGVFYYSYCSLGRLSEDDPIPLQMDAHLKARALSDRDAVFMRYARAKAAEDRGETSAVFTNLNAANRLLGKLFPYNFKQDAREYATIREAWAPLQPHLPAPDSSQAGPVFVTGLPRSGTTLVEQILASHPALTGGGELGWLGPKLSGPILSGHDPARLAVMLAEAGQSYAKAIGARFATMDVTDKSISTTALIGFVLAALPQAKIILVRRDPRDNAYSIYKSLFTLGRHRYGQSLQDLARYFRLVEDQIAFWQEALPGRVHVVRYEALVDDLESQAREIVRAAGLNWDAACLEFHQNKRRVDTLSSAQVRQPLYSSSVGKWTSFEADLLPFTKTYLELGGRYD